MWFLSSKLFITGSVAWVGITDEEEYLSVLLGFWVVFLIDCRGKFEAVISLKGFLLLNQRPHEVNNGGQREASLQLKILSLCRLSRFDESGKPFLSLSLQTTHACYQ